MNQLTRAELVALVARQREVIFALRKRLRHARADAKILRGAYEDADREASDARWLRLREGYEWRGRN